MINDYPVKEDTIIHNNVVVSGRQQLHSDAIDVRKANYGIVVLNAIQHNASETADPYASVEILTSPNNVNFDTWTSSADFVYTTALNLALDAGNTMQKTGSPFDLRHINYIKTVLSVKASGNLTSASLTLMTTR